MYTMIYRNHVLTIHLINLIKYDFFYGNVFVALVQSYSFFFNWP